MAEPSASLRIAIVAEHSSLKFGGEAALPLHYFRVLRKRGSEAWLVTHARTRDELLELFKQDADRILFVPDTWLHRAVARAGTRLPRQIQGMSTGFLVRLLTQTMQKRIVRRLVREQGITVVHQPIPVSPKEPSLMFGLGVPVVIGPMNGGMQYPPAFRHLESRWIRASVTLGRAVSHLVHVLLRGKREAAALLVANQRTRAALPRGASTNVIEFIENGVDLSVWSSRHDVAPYPSDITRFIFVGRLVDWKAVDLLLAAFHRAASSAPMTLTIVGDGPERERLEGMARSMGLLGADEAAPGKVSFLGWRSQAECAELLQRSDAMVLPSVWECGGAAVLEAMAMAVPVIATDWGGPADYLDPECGVLVPPTSRDQFIEGLTTAIIQLARSPEQRAAMGAAGRRKVLAEFDWDVKVERMLAVYQSVTRGPVAVQARLAVADAGARIGEV